MADLSYDIAFKSDTKGIETAEQEIKQLKEGLNQTAQTTKTFAQAVANIGTGRQGLHNINELINTIEQAGGSVTNLRQRYEQLANSFDNLNTREQGQQVRRLREYFESLGTSMTEVVGNSHKLDRELSDTGTQMQKLGKNAGTAQEKLQKTKQATEQLGSVTNTARTGIDKLSGALAALGIGLGVKELAETADAYSTLSARIAVAVGETGNVQEAMAGVQQIALATNADLTATAQLFAKIHETGKQMGLTQQQSLDLTKTIQQAISLSGGSAAAAEASITQLSQALASGVLRGDEFNSIAEQSPEIMTALANSLNVTTGELRTMAGEGKLSAQVVVNALQQQAGAIEEKFAKFPTTIGQAMQNIKTQWQIVVGEFNTESGASAVVVKALQTIGDNLAWLKNVFNDVGEGITWFSDKLSQIDDSTIDELKRTLSLAYDTVKDLAKSIGDMGETAWSAFKSVLDSVTPMFTAFTDGQKEVSSLDAGLHALQLSLGLLSDGATGVSIAFNLLVGSLQFLAGGMSTLRAKVAEFLGFEDLAKQSELAADRLFAAAEKSMGRANELALNFQSKVVQAIDEINKTEQQRNAESVADHKQTLADKTQAWQEFFLKERNFFAERQTLEEGLKLARQANDDERVQHHLNALAELDSAEQASTKTRQDLEKKKHDAVLAYAESAIKANKGIADEQLKAELSAQGFAVAISEAGKVSVTALNDVAKSSEQVGLSLKDSALNAAKGLGVDVKLALNEINSAFSANAEQVRQVADGYNELKQAGMDAGSLILASLDKLLEGAKSQKEIDTVRQLYVEFGRDGKLSTEQVESGLDAINDKLNKTPALLDETARAFKELGIISQAEAEATAQKQIQMFELVKNSGQASSEQLQEALQKVQKSIETSGNATQQAWLDSQQSALGLSQALDETSDRAKQVAKSAKNIGDDVAQGVDKGVNELKRLNGEMDKTAESLV
ncbi:tape measure protein, partial [Moraxella equi]